MMSTWLLETYREMEETNIRKRIVRQVGYLQRVTILSVWVAVWSIVADHTTTHTQ